MSTSIPSLAHRRRAANRDLRGSVNGIFEVRKVCGNFYSKTSELNVQDLLGYLKEVVFLEEKDKGLRYMLRKAGSVILESEETEALDRPLEVLERTRKNSKQACQNIGKFTYDSICTLDSLTGQLQLCHEDRSLGLPFHNRIRLALRPSERARVMPLGVAPLLEIAGVFRDFWQLCEFIIGVLEQISLGLCEAARRIREDIADRPPCQDPKVEVETATDDLDEAAAPLETVGNEAEVIGS